MTITEIAGGANAGSSTSLRSGFKTSVLNDYDELVPRTAAGMQTHREPYLPGAAGDDAQLQPGLGQRLKCRPIRQRAGTRRTASGS